MSYIYKGIVASMCFETYKHYGLILLTLYHMGISRRPHAGVTFFAIYRAEYWPKYQPQWSFALHDSFYA